MKGQGAPAEGAKMEFRQGREEASDCTCAAQAGLVPGERFGVESPWHYASLEHGLRGLKSADAAVLRPYIYVKPFAMTSAAQFRAGGPPALDSAGYAADLNETKLFGRATHSARSEAQTESARFYTYPPPVYWPRNLRQFGSAQASLADNARLMAQIWVAQTDSLIGTDEMSNATGVARIYGGMHFRFSIVDGALLGKKVANWIADRHFGPRD